MALQSASQCFDQGLRLVLGLQVEGIEGEHGTVRIGGGDEAAFIVSVAGSEARSTSALASKSAEVSLAPRSAVTSGPRAAAETIMEGVLCDLNLISRSAWDMNSS